MQNKLAQLLSPDNTPQLLFRAFGAILLLCLFVGIATEWYFLLGIPAFLLLAYLTVVDFHKAFLLLVACIPLSTELNLPSGLATDLPTEPLMVGLMLVGGAYALRHFRDLDGRYLRHPITLLLLTHLAWIVVTAITSQDQVVSVKFLLAKIWYVVPFYFLASRMLDGQDRFRAFFWAAFVPLLFTVVVTLIRHSAYGFSFADVFRVLHPFYRNHVTYASIIALFIPLVWFMRLWYPAYSLKWWFLVAGLVILLTAIQFSYTRAAYVAVVGAIGAYYAIRLRLMRYLLIVAFAAAIGLVAFMAAGNRYLDYAPNYETTVSHRDFNNLIQATYEMEDISTMERLYRWMAGFQMSAARPATGFGPGNFYNFYKPYAITSFRTYVSDNPDKSGIHSYFLMTLVEQGAPGLALFVLLCVYALLEGERIYHRTEGIKDKQIVMMALLSLVIILALLIINDLIETDKVGAFFFINLAILANMGLRASPKTPA
ncbi:MAG: O-antigen ligase family protein [Phaeodactylibacter sp.]|nr:O-antigen ligase family protein [Phaeodactylibacter sp.]MCB9275064.1 O-antigen ligase family protein [Lewinellaceae bacterium]